MQIPDPGLGFNIFRSGREEVMFCSLLLEKFEQKISLDFTDQVFFYRVGFFFITLITKNSSNLWNQGSHCG